MNQRFSGKSARPWLAACAFMVLAPGTAVGADTDVPVDLLGTCVACHGADGIGKAAQYPNLRGQKAAYLEKQLRAFRSGERKDVNMYPLAQGLSDSDIGILATWFAGLDEACSATGAEQ